MVANGSRVSRRRFLAAAGATGAVGGAALTGCSKKADNKTVRLSYLWTGREGKILDSLVQEFNASQTDYHVEGLSNSDTQVQLASMTAKKGAYDISDNFGSSTGSWASKGILQPLDDYIKRDGFDLTDFVPAALAQTQYNGGTYQLPIAINNQALFYNKALLDKAGIATPPKTIEDLAQAIPELTHLKGGQLLQLGFGSMDYTTMGMAFGGRWYQGDKPTPDDPHNVEAAQFYVDNVVKKYGVKPIQKFESGFGDYQSPQAPFYQGKLAMVIDGEWQPSFIKQFAPTLEWGVVPIPYPSASPQNADTNQVATGSFFIPANSQNKEGAWAFMKFIMSKEAMLKFTSQIANAPARTSLLDSKDYDIYPHFDVFLKLLKSKNAVSLPSAASYAQYTADLSDAMDAISRLTKTPQQAYAEVAKKAQAYA